MALEKLKFHLAALLILFLASNIWGETITDIQVQGLKRTKPAVLLEKLEKFKGIDSSDLDKKKLEAELEKTQLISLSDATVSGSTLHITVEEKFSLLPIPFAYAASDSWGGGLVVVDNNAFGLMDQAAAGGFITSSGWRALAGYSHIQKAHSPFGWNISANGGQSKTRVRDDEGDLLLSYDNSTFSAAAGLNRRLSPWLRASVSSGVDICDVDDESPASELVIPLTASLTASTASWDGTFLNTIYLTTSVTYNFSQWHSDNYCTLAAKAGYQQHLVQRLRLIAQGGLFHSPDVPVVFAKNQSAVQVCLLNNACRASSMVGAGAGFEWGIANTRFGVPSLYIQYQTIWADSIMSDDFFGHGPVAGFKFYLKKIAFPAVDIFTAYNVKTGLIRTSAGAGFSY
ncbi:MAG: hypothetical protein J6U56_08570 [Spirochaetia bacterium]|nr:hypothetical protein [Spirochaetia bacterium]